MPTSFENPFIPKPDNLDPNQADFLKKYASASEEQLKKAGLAKEATSDVSKPVEEVASLKDAASEEEKTAYLNELVECGGANISRADVLKIQNILKKLNQDRITNGQEEVTLGNEIKIDCAQIGGKTKEELKAELKKANIQISSYADDLLNSSEFEPLKAPEDITLIRLTIGDLGFPQGATTEEIFNKAQELGLDLCPPETGPQLRIKVGIEQRFGEYFNIAMKQITDSDGDPSVFFLDRRTDGQWLGAGRAEPSYGWDDGNPFVFRLPAGRQVSAQPSLMLRRTSK